MKKSSGRMRARGRALSVAAVLGLAVAFPTAADAAKKPLKPSKPTVMTRNLYLGADLAPAIAAPNAGAAYTAVGNIYEHMRDLNFNARAKLLANEIEETDPDLVGLQEVSHWFRDNAPPDGPATQSTETVYDYLHQLMSELRERGLNYSVAVVQNEADLEFPADFTGDGVPENDVRLLMRDVILAKDNVKVKETGGGNFPLNATVNTAAFGPVTVLRGYTYADVRVNTPDSRGTLFRFINTHLEAFSSVVANAQAGYIVTGSGITDITQPVVLVGDFNSDPTKANAAAYNTIVGDGFSDMGVTENTCCFSEGIRDANPDFTSRIDHVMGKNAVGKKSAHIVGADQDNRSGTGLWPSDHAGVVADLVAS